MSKLIADISISLDGFAAGPDASLDEPLGRGGEQLHEWAFALRAFRETHGMEGGETGPDDELVRLMLERVGATIMGRRMFSGGEGSWDQDPRADGWWGDEPPFHHPVYVLTSQPREPLVLTGTTFTFVTDGIHAALEQAVAAAGGKDVTVGGGADAIQQYLAAGLVDELSLHVAPFLLGTGVRLFDERTAQARGRLELASVFESTSGTVHLTYR